LVGGESDEPDPALTPEIGRLQAIAEEEGVTDLVKFVGRRARETLKYYYSAADVFVTVPWYEPFGITPLEAMACGTPVVGSNVGGIKYTVRDGETGYLVPPKDPDRVAERLAHLYQHPKLMSVLSKQAVRRANDLFTWDKVAKLVAAVYEEVLAAGATDHADEAEQTAVIERGFDEAVDVLQQSRRRLRPFLPDAAAALATCLAGGGKVLLGGSPALAPLFAAELSRAASADNDTDSPVLALNTDDPFRWPGDAPSSRVFARQVEALGRTGDVFVGLSQGGCSPACLAEALKAARRNGLRALALLGEDGASLRDLADIALVVPSSQPCLVSEAHLAVLRLLCQLVRNRLSTPAAAAQPADVPARNGRRHGRARDRALAKRTER
jgi:phosphoheptose isomerase